MLACAQEEIGDLVERDQFLVRHVTDEVDVRGIQRGRQLVERRQVPLEPALRADNQQPRSRVDERVVGVEVADQVLDLLVGDDAADKQDVGPVVVEILRHQPVRRPVEVREIRDHRQHGGAWKPERLEVLSVELGIAEREVAAVRVGAQLAPAAKALDAPACDGRRRSTPVA